MKKLALLLVGVLALTLALPAFAYNSDGAELSETREIREAEERERHEAEERERRDEARRLRKTEAQDEESGEEAALMAGGSATVSVTVRLPDGATVGADDYATVYLYSAAEIAASGRVTKEAASVKSAKANFTQGSSATAVLFENVPAGNYILHAYTSRMTGGKIVNSGDIYYNADGSIASSGYAASAFSVSEGASVSKAITLPASESSISGVLTFSSPLSQDTEFELYCSGQGRDSGYYYVYFTGRRGAYSVPFAIGVTSDCYSLEFSREGSYYYLNYDGELMEDYEYNQLYYCNALSGADVSGLSVNGDILLGETETAETVKADVAVTLPAALSQERRFMITAVYQSGSSTRSKSSSATVQAGQVSFSKALTLETGKEYAIGYRDTTDCYSIYGVNTSKDIRYASKDGGITTLYENAKKFSFTADGSVSIQEPACGVVTGSVSRNGFNSGFRADAYAYALFPDGERYCARVLMGNADSAQFAIYVPLTQNGQSFQLSAAMARPETNYPIGASASEPVSLTFNGNVSAGTVPVSGDYFSVSGAISLPDGVKAPAGGQAVAIEAQYENGAHYVIPAGQNSVSFSFDAYGRENYGGESLQAYLEGRLPGVYGEVSQSQYFNNDASDSERKAWYQNQSLAFPASAVISGSVSLPSGAGDVGATMEIYSYLSDRENPYSASAYSYVSILKGRNSSAYAFTVPMGKLSYLQLQMLGSTDGRAADDTLYVGGDWTSSKEWADGPTVTGDRSGVNFTLEVFNTAVTPEIVSVSSNYSHEEVEDVLDGLRESSTLYVTCTGPTGTNASLFAVIYDSDGRFLGVATQSYADLSRAGSENYLSFDSGKAADAAAVRVFLLDRETYAPLAKPAAF